MNKDLITLVKLHDVDLKIIDLELSKEEFPATVEKLESEVVSAKETVDSLEVKIGTLKKEEHLFIYNIFFCSC